MILGGQLERAGAGTEGPGFTIKGAVALELRIPARGRATKDIDLIVDKPGDMDLEAALREALSGTYQGFTFRVKRDPYLMPHDALRMDVALEYRGRSWATVRVDLSPLEGDRTEVEFVEPLPLEPFGLDTPRALPCLSLRYHIAQKIHAMTRPALDEETPNERFRDLVDLLLMKEFAADLRGVREACEDVFAMRRTHAWPPLLDPPQFWEAPFAALAEEVSLAAASLDEAVLEAAAFIDAIVMAG